MTTPKKQPLSKIEKAELEEELQRSSRRTRRLLRKSSA
jgi:hypothetical protein